MIAMPLASPGLSKSQALSRALSQTLASSTPPSTFFQPLDPGVVNASIPTFFVGRNRDGFWVARDTKGENGGMFLFRSSALAFARRTSRPYGCATVFPSERFELDVKNEGNPLVDYLRPLLRFLIVAKDAAYDEA